MRWQNAVFNRRIRWPTQGRNEQAQFKSTSYQRHAFQRIRRLRSVYVIFDVHFTLERSSRSKGPSALSRMSRALQVLHWYVGSQAQPKPSNADATESFVVIRSRSADVAAFHTPHAICAFMYLYVPSSALSSDFGMSPAYHFSNAERSNPSLEKDGVQAPSLCSVVIPHRLSVQR